MQIKLYQSTILSDEVLDSVKVHLWRVFVDNLKYATKIDSTNPLIWFTLGEVFDDFDYIVLNDRGSEIGIEGRFYQAESLFELKQFDDAIDSYTRFLQYSDDQEKIEYCKFKICKCYYNIF